MWDWCRTFRYPSCSGGVGNQFAHLAREVTMERVAQTVFRHGLAQLRRWGVGFPAGRPAAQGGRLRSLSPGRRVLVLAVICADLAWAAVLARGYAPSAKDL